MKITYLKLLNILGHDEFVVKPGDKLTLVQGKNATGKSSILKALQAAFKGQSVNEATLLRNGAEAGEIVVELSDGTTIKKKITTEGSKSNKSTKHLSEIADSFGLNPVEFLLMNNKDKLRTLLEILNVHATHEEMEECAPFIELPEQELFNLDEIARVRKQVYDERTATNRMLKDKEATLKQMEAVIPLEYDEVQHKAVKQKIEEARQQKESHLADLENQKHTEMLALNKKYDELKVVLGNKFDEHVRPLTDELSIIENNLKSVGAYEEQMKFIKTLNSEIEKYTERSDILESSLNYIDNLEKSKMSSFPIPGLSINEGNIYLDGVRLEHVNSARQISFVMNLAAKKMGELKAMVVDGIELLDSVKRKQLFGAIEKADIQMILTQVTDTELEIITK